MQIFIAGLCTLFLEVVMILGVPLSYNHDYRYPRSPHRTVMLSGYYGRPSHHSSEYNPEGAMTAFVTGDTLATNSYLGSNPNFPQEPEELEVPAEDNIAPDVTPPILSQADNAERQGEGVKHGEVLENGGASAKRNRKIKPVKPPQADEEEEDEGAWPFQLGQRGHSYNTFFPILFGGYRGIKGRDADGGYPGSATAIANSFSTGRGGVASSHATAYGDPSISTSHKNGFKKRPTPKDD